MRTRFSAALGVWRARSVTTSRDRALLLYMGALVALVVVVPLGRAVWLSVVSPGGVALFAGSAAPTVATGVVAALWAAALLVGRDRGPAVRSPFLTWALSTSALSRVTTFGGPVLRSGVLVTAVCSIAAGVIGASLASQGLATVADAVGFTAIGSLVGVIGVVAWLAGQVFPKTAVAAAIGIIAIGTLTIAIPALQPFTPWGWVGIAYPGAGTSNVLMPMVALAGALAAAAPALLNRLASDQLVGQATRWDSAATLATGLDLGAAAGIYQARPVLGRRIRAVRPRRHLGWMFVVRDAVGAIRTPGRFLVGVLAISAGGVLLVFAFAPATPGWLFGATAGVLVFAGLGPLTDGVRHAANVAADFPLYGISDEQLLTNHALFPLAVVVLVLFLAVIVGSILIGITPGAAIVGAIALGLIALGNRIGNALKGPLPPFLLTPAPTAAGDPMAAVRAAWAVDGLLLATLGGAAAAVVFQVPLLIIGVTITVAGIVINRWRTRR
jgi:hypothetical protein